MLRCKSIASTLRSQLSSAFELEESNETCIVHTPFLYPDNTMVALQIACNPDGSFRLSDDGTAHEYAWISGVSRQRLETAASAIESRFNVAATGGQIVKQTEEVSLLRGMVDAIMATQGIAETVVSRTPSKTTSSFRREIETYLAINNRSYERDVLVQGKTGKRKVDYRVDSSDASPQLALFQISGRTRLEHAESVAFRVGDILTSEASYAASFRLAILIEDAFGDRLDSTPEQWHNVLRTVKGSGAKTYLWSDKTLIEELLAA